MRKSALGPLLVLCACTFGQSTPGADGDGEGDGDVGTLSTTGEEIEPPTTSGADGSAGAPDDDDDDDDADSTGPMSDDDDDATTTGDDDDDDGDDDDDDDMNVCKDGLFWSADFSVDPTTLDVNDDAINDWAMRDGSPFPIEELTNGIWSSIGRDLDTRPLDDFQSRLLVDVRMRATSPGFQGAVFWVNVNYDVTFSPIWVRARGLPNGDQVVTLLHKTDGATSVPLIEVDGFDSDFIDVSLEIDTDAGEVSLWIDDNYEGTESYASFPIGGNDDRYATLIGWGATAEFDEVTIEQCP